MTSEPAPEVELKGGRLWVMPLGAEPLATDGKQLFYGTEDGLGSTVALGEGVSMRLKVS
ncbi:MAG: hypothetical protein QOG34_1304 [Frankiaceae bacterium]|jgi:hypothetical protein|nr:hypothetical protein [Frankiaceae bacterium]